MGKLQSYYSEPSLFQYSFHISLDPPFIYVNNAKCGCVTAKASINRWHAAWHGESQTYQSLGDVHNRRHNRLLTPGQLGAAAEDVILHDRGFFRFTLLRDPVSRIVSAYQSKLTWDSPERQMVNRMAGRPVDDELTFTEFLALIRANKTLRDKNEHWRQQSLQVAAPLIHYDQICLFGSLDRDLLRIRDRLFPGVSLGVFETVKYFPQNQSGSHRLLEQLGPDDVAGIREAYAEDFALYDKVSDSRPPGDRPPRPATAARDAGQMAHILQRFESLGDNCEFGFAQRAYGIDTGGLLRWGFSQFPSMIRAFQGNLQGIFQFDNLVPYTNDMVRDTRSNICFHSQMKSNGTSFLADAQVRQSIFSVELSKIEYMTKKLLNRMKDPSVILVYKCNRNVSDTEIETLSETLAPFGSAQLLVVRTGNDHGTVRRVNNRLMLGIIDRFAPYNEAHNVSLDLWMQIVRAADALCPFGGLADGDRGRKHLAYSDCP
jgi:hypothetical protein